MTLFSLGWNDSFAENFRPFASNEFLPARVALQVRPEHEAPSALPPEIGAIDRTASPSEPTSWSHASTPPARPT